MEGFLLMLGLWATLALRLPGDYGELEIGKPSPTYIPAPRSVEFTSAVRTEEKQAQAENRPENLVYTTDISIPSQQRNLLSELLDTIKSVRNDPTLGDSAKLRALTSLPSATVAITQPVAESILALDDDAWNMLQAQVLTLYDRAMSEYAYELDERAVAQLRERSLPYWTNIDGLSPRQRELALFFTTSFLRVNHALDQAATEQRKREARASVSPVEVRVQQGEKIVGAGEIVSPEMIEKLEATGALPRSQSWVIIGAEGLLAGLLALAYMLYLHVFHNELGAQPRPLLVIILLLIITSLAARLLTPLWSGQSYGFPLATVALILAVVFNGRLALASITLLGIVVGVLDGYSLSLTITMLLGGMVAVFLVRGAERLLAFLLAGLGIAAVTVVAQITLWLASSSMVSPELLLANLIPLLLFGSMNGGLSAILALGLFNLIGRAAGVVTPLQLMELAHPNQPLLRKLIREAPGTYYHSVAVGNLAEAAAEAVGADALLLRVAAYYHDIGKTIRPYFFTDNQIGRENVHNDLDPRTSSQIIVDHVREGVKMARAAHLPPPIIDFISTHHGTHLIKHFYQIALQQQDAVNIDDYRYPGPKPTTREQGILMLADSVEATVRSKAQNGKLVPTRQEEHGRTSGQMTVEELVGSIIDDRVRDGQLDQTPLTLRELVLIRQTFVSSLRSIYHPRVDYTPRMAK